MNCVNLSSIYSVGLVLGIFSLVHVQLNLMNLIWTIANKYYSLKHEHDTMIRLVSDFEVSYS